MNRWSMTLSVAALSSLVALTNLASAGEKEAQKGAMNKSRKPAAAAIANQKCGGINNLAAFKWQKVYRSSNANDPSIYFMKVDGFPVAADVYLDEVTCLRADGRFSAVGCNSEGPGPNGDEFNGPCCCTGG